MSNSYYKKDDPTKVVTIVDKSQDAFFELSNGQMIKKDVFFKYYSERDNVPNVNESFKPRSTNTGEINPDTFFTSSSIVNQDDIMKLKNADPSKGVLDGQERTEVLLNTSNKMKDAKPVFNEKAKQPLKQPAQNESIVQQVDPSTQPIPDHTNTDVSQYRVYENEDDAYADFVHNASTPQAPPPPPKQQTPQVEVDQIYEDEKFTFGLEEAERRRNVRLKRTSQPATQQPIQQTIVQQQTNPTETMFKTFKRNHDITINVKFTDKIGNPDFIKLMMENMDGDIVGFYKQLIVENIKNNFNVIEDEIEKQIRLEIFGATQQKIEKKEEEKIDLSEETIVNLKDTIEKLQSFSKQIIDKSNEIQFNDDLDDDYLYDLIETDDGAEDVEESVADIDAMFETPIGIDAEEEINKLVIKGSPDFLKTINLIPGGTTSIGKQLYKYVDDRGRTREVLPETAEKNGWKPLTNE
jgi:hypothetical protein